MTTPQEFDAHAAIRKLAEWERRCTNRACHAGTVDILDVGGTRLEVCPTCKGIGFEMPFEALRIISHSRACSEYGRAVKYSHAPNEVCLGYRIEQDVRVACWEVFKVLPNRIKQEVASAPFKEGDDSWEQAVLRAAEQWMEEQNGT